MGSRLSRRSLILACFTVAVDVAHGYAIFFREHNLPPRNFQVHDFVDNNPDVCYDVTTESPIPDIEGVGLINGAQAGVLVRELANLPGLQAPVPQNLRAIALYQGVENFDCVGKPDALIRFHDPQDPLQTTVQYVDLGKTDPPLLGRYRFWKPVDLEDPEIFLLLSPRFGAGYVRVLQGRIRKPAYTDENGNLLVTWAEFPTYEEARASLTGQRVGPAAMEPDSKGLDRGYNDLVEEGFDYAGPMLLKKEGDADGEWESWDSVSQIEGGNEEPAKVEELDGTPLEPQLQSNMQFNQATEQQGSQIPAAQPNSIDLNPGQVGPVQEPNAYVRSTAEIGTQTEPEMPQQFRIQPEGVGGDLPQQDQSIYLPQAQKSRPIQRVTGHRPVNEVARGIQQAFGFEQQMIDDYVNGIARFDTDIRKRASDMISRIAAAPGTAEYEKEAEGIIAAMEEAQGRELRRRVYEPLSDTSLDHQTARGLVEIGNQYLLWEQQVKANEKALRSHGLDNIEPMDPNLAQSHREQLQRSQQQLQQGQAAGQIQVQAPAQGEPGQEAELVVEEEDDNLFAEPKPKKGPN
ncbi:hypothetical protein TWF281_006526 [Arthrobotrys megalospora]